MKFIAGLVKLFHLEFHGFQLRSKPLNLQHMIVGFSNSHSIFFRVPTCSLTLVTIPPLREEPTRCEIELFMECHKGRGQTNLIIQNFFGSTKFTDMSMNDTLFILILSRSRRKVQHRDCSTLIRQENIRCSSPRPSLSSCSPKNCRVSLRAFVSVLRFSPLACTGNLSF